MKEIIEQAVKTFLERIKAEMPETGSFEPIIVGFDNTDESLVVEKFFLEAMQPPKGVENYEIKRAIKFWGRRKGSGREVEVLLISDAKQKCIAKINEDDFIDRLMKHAEKISHNLIDL